MAAQERVPLWRQLQRRCIHFNGLINDTCKAGVLYSEARDESTRPYRYACFQRIGDKGQLGSQDDVAGYPEVACPRAQFLTEAEAKAEEAESRKEIKAFFDEMASGKCPHCHQPMTKRQVGRCVYAEPCGHRLYQGKV